MMSVRLRVCNAAPGQWCAYGRIYTATGRAVALDPSEAQDGVKIHCGSVVSDEFGIVLLIFDSGFSLVQLTNWPSPPNTLDA
jgi:hypothetical protein